MHNLESLRTIKRDKILVVDDDPDWLCECKFMLEMLDYDCALASNRTKAMEMIEQEDIFTVITDYNMPACDGLTLMQDLIDYADRDGRSLRFILVTGHASLEVAVAALRAHVSDFLEKPVSHEQLSKALLRTHGVHLTGQSKANLVEQLKNLSGKIQHVSHLIYPKNREITKIDNLNKIDVLTTDFIEKIILNEKNRRKIGNGTLFGDPSWSMLLEMLIAQMEGRKVAVSSACIASGSPTTTAMRLINRLVTASILTRIPDANDGRRDFLIIEPEIEKSLVTYLTELSKIN